MGAQTRRPLANAPLKADGAPKDHGKPQADADRQQIQVPQIADQVKLDHSGFLLSFGKNFI